jgi:hypothetical protein
MRDGPRMWCLRLVGTVFQTLGFVGLIAGQDQGSHAAIWSVFVAVGFGVGLPAGCVYFLLRWRSRRRERAERSETVD